MAALPYLARSLVVLRDATRGDDRRSARDGEPQRASTRRSPPTSHVSARGWPRSRAPTSPRAPTRSTSRSTARRRSAARAISPRSATATLAPRTLHAALRRPPLRRRRDGRRTPRRGPCDERRARCRGASGLYVSDASALPGNTGVNPQITIMAHALRVADAIVDAEAGRALTAPPSTRSAPRSAELARALAPLTAPRASSRSRAPRRRRGPRCRPACAARAARLAARRPTGTPLRQLSRAQLRGPRGGDRAPRRRRGRATGSRRVASRRPPPPTPGSPRCPPLAGPLAQGLRSSSSGVFPLVAKLRPFTALAADAQDAVLDDLAALAFGLKRDALRGLRTPRLPDVLRRSRRAPADPPPRAVRPRRRLDRRRDALDAR